MKKVSLLVATALLMSSVTFAQQAPVKKDTTKAGKKVEVKAEPKKVEAKAVKVEAKKADVKTEKK